MEQQEKKQEIEITIRRYNKLCNKELEASRFQYVIMDITKF